MFVNNKSLFTGNRNNIDIFLYSWRALWISAEFKILRSDWLMYTAGPSEWRPIFPLTERRKSTCLEIPATFSNLNLNKDWWSICKANSVFRIRLGRFRQVLTILLGDTFTACNRSMFRLIATLSLCRFVGQCDTHNRLPTPGYIKVCSDGLVRRRPTSTSEQEAQLSYGDLAMHYVSWNLAAQLYEKIAFEKACNRWITLKVTQGHPKWRDSIGHSPISGLVNSEAIQHLHFAPFSRHS